MMPGDADAAFVNGAFEAAEGDGGGAAGRGAVVAAVPEERVVSNVLVFEVVAEFADGAVHGGDFGEAFAKDFTEGAFGLESGFHAGELDDSLLVALGQIVVEGEVFFEPAVGFVGRAEPDDGEEGFSGLFGFTDEADGFVDDDFGAFAFEASGAGPPLRERTGFISKKLSWETHWSKPMAPGFVGDSFLTGPRCHLPKWPVV